MNIPKYWRNREQYLRLAGIEKVDQAHGIGLAHMRSSAEVIEQVKKLRAMMEEQAIKDKEALALVRKKIDQ
ncbi:MAG: hypothetical protein ACOZAK_00250 [Patescibacteria group bacterium]